MYRTQTVTTGTCSASTAGPARLQCQRGESHPGGHLWIGLDVADGRHEDEG